MAMSQMRAKTHVIALSVKAAALGAFSLYLFWNAYWIGMGEIPDSILRAFAGIPSPTTGGTRSIVALIHREWAQSLLWNPLTIVYMALMASSVWLLGHQAMGGKRLALPPILAWLWAGSLVAGWILKLTIGPEYW